MHDEGKATAIGVSGSQGVQVGSGNTQYNGWPPKAPLDLASLGALNPHVAVARLQLLSHDELVDLFARVSPRAISKVLTTFMEADEARVVAILADIDRRQAAALIKPFTAASGWLPPLPEASEAIARKATALKWVQAEGLERYHEGYVRRYKNGRIFWASGYGTRVVSGAIEEYHSRNSDWLKRPLVEQQDVTSSSGVVGVCQDFVGGTVYSSEHGVKTVQVATQDAYKSVDGNAGWLGFAVGEISINSSKSWTQHFEGGAIYYREGKGAFAVRKLVAKAMSSYQEFCPIARESAATSSFGTRGGIQRFRVELGENAQEMAACFADRSPVILIAPEVWSYYNKLGAERSWLGFPVQSAEQTFRVGGFGQAFEGGWIFWGTDTGPAAVSNEVNEAIEQVKAKNRDIGLPVSEGQPIGVDSPDRIQFFENGVVTLRDDKREIWVRP